MFHCGIISVLMISCAVKGPCQLHRFLEFSECYQVLLLSQFNWSLFHANCHLQHHRGLQNFEWETMQLDQFLIRFLVQRRQCRWILCWSSLASLRASGSVKTLEFGYSTAVGSSLDWNFVLFLIHNYRRKWDESRSVLFAFVFARWCWQVHVEVVGSCTRPADDGLHWLEIYFSMSFGKFWKF